MILLINRSFALKNYLKKKLDRRSRSRVEDREALRRERGGRCCAEGRREGLGHVEEREIGRKE
jgi:hypothetical protein